MIALIIYLLGIPLTLLGIALLNRKATNRTWVKFGGAILLSLMWPVSMPLGLGTLLVELGSDVWRKWTYPRPPVKVSAK